MSREGSIPPTKETVAMTQKNRFGEMTRRILIGALFALLILFVPIPTGQAKDGGTRTYRALTYRIVRWNCFFNDPIETEDGTSEVVYKYQKTTVYWFSNASRSITELWQAEKETPDFCDYLVPD